MSYTVVNDQVCTPRGLGSEPDQHVGRALPPHPLTMHHVADIRAFFSVRERFSVPSLTNVRIDPQKQGIRNRSSQPFFDCPRLGEYAEFDGSSKLGSYCKWYCGGFMHRRG
jgi:hypothetical protein